MPYGHPAPPHPAMQLVGDTERDHVVERIKTAFAEGRLDHAEFDQRTHLALTARTRSDLAAVLAGLDPPPPTPVSVPARSVRPTAGERGWALAAHWLPLVSSFVGPLIVYLAMRDQSRFVRQQSAEALNFQLTFIFATILMPFVAGATLGLAALLYIPVVFAWFGLTVAGGFVALAGDPFRYPFNLRMVR